MDQQSATADALLLTVNVAALLCLCSAGRVIPTAPHSKSCGASDGDAWPSFLIHYGAMRGTWQLSPLRGEG